MKEVIYINSCPSCLTQSQLKLMEDTEEDNIRRRGYECLSCQHLRALIKAEKRDEKKVSPYLEKL
jgi:Zn ribbon nucleic-acid-binding protein